MTDPKILITGKGTSGSWQIRGVQLGTAMGAEVLKNCNDFEQFDIVIGVKRIPEHVQKALKQRTIPFVWDIVDAWPQKDPNGNLWCMENAINWLRKAIKDMAPDAMVFPTTQMQADSGWEGPSLVLAHHAWPKYTLTKIRQIVTTVGYEGGEQYLGRWRQIVEKECKKRGWFFSINANMASNDIVLAVRDMDGYPTKHWKSNCKLANIQGLGLPAICSVEDSYLEFGSGAEIFVVDEPSLINAFDTLTPFKARSDISKVMWRWAPSLVDVSQEYLAWLRQLKS